MRHFDFRFHSRLGACTGFATLCAFGLVGQLGSTAHGQGIETPQASPHAKVEQHVGLTDVTVDYSSPAVKGRKLWGDLVPWDKPWRTGANAATKLTVSRDFVFGSSKVKAGTYSLYTVPGKASWTVIIGSNADVWGTDVADKDKIVAQMSVKPSALAQPRERMVFIFSDTTDATANLDLEWEKLRVRIPIAVDTKGQVSASIEKVLGDSWRPYQVAARYLLESGGDLDRALSYIDKSIAIQSTWNNNWMRSQILAKKGMKAEARAAAQQAQKLGSGEDYDFYKDQIAKAAAESK
jgi:Protein of unknown function (DUF2911)